MALNTLYESKIYHERLIPFNHKFSYKIFSLNLNVRELDFKGLRLLSHNRFNLFSFYDSDYLDDSQNPLIEKINSFCIEMNVEIQNDDQIELFTMPRFLGFVFNPVSFWKIKDINNEVKLIIAEVNNTFGEKHFYFLNSAGENARLQTKKEFHVSPFFDRNGQYHFKFSANNISIKYVKSEDEQYLFFSNLIHVAQHELTDRKLLATVFRYPLQPFLVVLRIHWQAFKLYFKGASFYKKPIQLKPNMTEEFYE